MHDVVLIAGDGIGPEITAATRRILNAAGARINWIPRLAGEQALAAEGELLPHATIAAIRDSQIALKGPLATPIGGGFRSVNVALRQEFDLYANIRPARSVLRQRPFGEIDMVIIRENTEGLYCGIEREIPGGAESVMLVTQKGAERIIRYAFDYALANGRKTVTLAHKANILKLTQGLMLRVAEEIAKEYDGRVEFKSVIIDAAAMQMVRWPADFDVVVCENLFGDILSDLAAGMIGGLGLTPGANIGQDTAIFEAVHGTAPDIAGRGVANPTALILAACMMLDHLGELETSARIRHAVEACLTGSSSQRTGDLGGTATTDEFADAVIAQL